MKLPETWSSTKADTRQPNSSRMLERLFSLLLNSTLSPTRAHTHTHTHTIFPNHYYFSGPGVKLAILTDTGNGKKGRTNIRRFPRTKDSPFCACRTDRHIIIDTHQHFGAFFGQKEPGTGELGGLSDVAFDFLELFALNFLV